MAQKNDSTAQLVENRFKFASDKQRETFDDFARYRALWQSKITDDGGSYPWDYSLFSPMIFSTIRSFVARTSSGNVGVDLQAWNEQDRPKTRINKALLDWEFQEANLFQVVSRWVFAAALYGKGFVGTGWKFSKERIIEEQDESGKKREILMSPKVNRADLSNIRPYDIFIANRNNPDLQDQPWVVQRMYKTVGELEQENDARGEKIYKNLDKLKKKDYFVRFVDYGADVAMGDAMDSKDLRWKSGLLEILRMYDKEAGTVIEKIRGHNEFILREEDNPYYHGEYPIVDLSFFPEDDEFWSTGAVRPVEDLQMALNSTLNQYLTNANQQLNNMWITSDLRIPEWEFISRPNGVIHVSGDINALKEVQHKDITSNALAMMNTIEQKITRTTGVTDQLTQGTPDQNVTTATGQQLQQHNLDANMQLFMNMLEQVAIKRVTRQFLALNAQFITSDQTIRITGRHGYSHMEIKPDDVSASFDPIVIPNSTLPKNPMIRSQNLMNLKALADKEVKVNVNTAPIWKELLDTMGMTDLDEIIPDDIDEAMEENELLKKGVPVDCEPNDNHAKHIQIHQYPLIAEQLGQAVTKRFVAHIQAHKNWKLAADPTLLEKMASGGTPQPGEIQQGLDEQGNQASQQTPQSPPQGVPLPNPAADLGGLIQQQGAQQALPPPPAGLPLPDAGQGGGF